MELIELKQDKLRIDPTMDIKEPPVYCSINNCPALTAGNFSLINGKKKSGKTFLLGGILASVISNSTQLDKIRGCLPDNKNVVLYFDTEQSEYHANRSVKRICSLIGNKNPENLLAFGLRPLSPEERLRKIESLITTTPNVGLVAIDGIRDLLTTGINDEQAATYLTNLFLKWSYDLQIHIVLLLHKNKNDENARGHIGSEVVNKAETIISVTMLDNNKFKVTCEASRDISFDDFGFTITEDGLPTAIDLPCSTKKVTDPSKIKYENHLEKLRCIFDLKSDYNYDELTSKLKEVFSIGRDASEKFITFYLAKNWLVKTKQGRTSCYNLNTNASSFFYNPN